MHQEIGHRKRTVDSLGVIHTIRKEVVGEKGGGVRIGISEGVIERAQTVVPPEWPEGHLKVVLEEEIGIQGNPEFQEINEVREREEAMVRDVDVLPQHSSP